MMNEASRGWALFRQRRARPTINQPLDQAYAALRDRMVAEQIARRGLRDPRVLEAMAAVPRHLFVPLDQRHGAYEDRPLAIGEGQTISQPYMVALMTSALEARDGDRVLEIGTGSGYQAAVLSKLVQQIVSVERQPRLAAAARETLKQLGIGNVTVMVGDGSEGVPALAPYEGIIVTAGAPRVPETLRAQLAEGGRLVIPVGTADHQEIVVVRRRGDAFEEARSEGCVFVPLIGRYGWREER